MKKTKAGKARKAEKKAKRQRPIDLVLSRLHLSSIDGGTTKANCPAHDDRVASLSISEGDDGRVLLHCHAGCGLEDILEKLKLSVSDLFVQGKTQHFDYTDEDGELLYQSVRKPGKKFFQRRPDPDNDGEWINNVKGVRPVLYRLPELKGENVCIVEGEKDVETLCSLDIVATTNAGGAGKWRDEYTEQLTEADVKNVYVFADNDDAGREHQQDVARSCFAAGLTVKTIDLPGLPPKGDVSDWLLSHTKDDLAEIVKNTALYTEAVESSSEILSDVPDKIPEVPEESYVGLGAVYADLMAELTETPKQFYYFAFLTYLGASVAQYIELKSIVKAPARLYTVLLAPTGRRKSNALWQTRLLFSKARTKDGAEGRDLGFAVIQNAGSGEGVANAMRARAQEEEDDGGKELALMEIDELSALAAKMEIKGASLLSLLTTLFEANRWQMRVKYKNESVELEDAHLSLIGATTFKTFDTLFHLNAFDQGLLNRFWIVPGNVTKDVPNPQDYPDEYDALVKDLRKLLKKFDGTEYMVRFSPEVEAIYDEYYTARPKDDQGERVEGYVKRLAILMAVSVGKVDEDAETVMVSPKIMRAAVALAGWQYQVRQICWPIMAEGKIAMLE